MISVKPGGFQIPMHREQPINIQSRNGNSGNGGRPNVPTLIPQQPGSFPRVNLNPQFRIGQYNNAQESFNYPRFNEYWKNQYNTNNPIGPTNKKGWSKSQGLKVGGFGGHGSLRYQIGPGYTTQSWDTSRLAQLGVDSGMSTSYPYNANSMNLPGGVRHVWPDGNNINMGEESEVLPGYKLVVKNKKIHLIQNDETDETAIKTDPDGPGIQAK